MEAGVLFNTGCALVLYTLFGGLPMELGNKRGGQSARLFCPADMIVIVHYGFKQAMYTAFGHADDAPSVFGQTISRRVVIAPYFAGVTEEPLQYLG